MCYLHTMLRVRNLDAALKFYRDAFGLKKEVRRIDNDKGRFTLVFLCAPEDIGLLEKLPKTRGAPLVELTYNWDEEKYGEDRYFGHLAYEVDDIYATCDRLMKMGITINRPPRDGNMAFVRSPDLHSIELLQKGDPKPPAEPWSSDAEHRPLVSLVQILRARPSSRLSHGGQGGRAVFLPAPARSSGGGRAAARPVTSTPRCATPSTVTAIRCFASGSHCPSFRRPDGTAPFAVRHRRLPLRNLARPPAFSSMAGLRRR